MKRDFTLSLDGVPYSVVVDGDTITVNGRPFQVEIEEDRLLVDGVVHDITLDGETVSVAGETHIVAVQGLGATPGSASASRSPSASPLEGGSGAIVAIMPGKIVRVLVKPGEEVVEGTAVCVLEAMKMENELLAPLSGVVQAVYAQVGDDVEKDQILIKIE